MKKFRVTPVAFLLLAIVAPLSGAVVETQFDLGKQLAIDAEVSALAAITSDRNDRTVSFSVRSKHGLLIRAHSIWATEDGGRTWHKTGQVGRGKGPSTFESAWSRTQADVFALADGLVFESTNQGRQWKRKGTASKSLANFSTIRGDEAGTWLLMAGQRSIPIGRKSRNEVPKYAGDVASTPESPSMWAPALLRSADNGRTWQQVQLPRGIGPLDKIVVSGSSAVVIGPYIVFTSIDSGRSWRAGAEDGLDNAQEEAYPLGAAILQTRFWISEKNGTVLSGELARGSLSPMAKFSGPIGDLAFIDSCEGFGLGENGFLATTDSGATWRGIKHAEDVVAFSASPSRIVAATHNQILQINLPGNRSAGCGN